MLTDSEAVAYQLSQEAPGITIDDRMHNRVEEWVPRWTADPVDYYELQKVLLLLQPLLPDQEPIRMGICSLRQLLAGAPILKGLGGDSWQLRDWSTLPDEALAVLEELLFQIQTTTTWPRQCALVFISMIPKPAGGERPIALTAI